MRSQPASSTPRPARRAFEFCLAALAAAGLLWAVDLAAVPPTPPATVDLVAVEASGRLPDASGRIAFRARVAGQGRVDGELTLTAMLVRVDDVLDLQRQDLERRRIPARERETPVELVVPVRGAGHYEVTVEVRGGREGAGFSDREIAHVLVEADGGYRVLSGRAYARETREARERDFREQLARDPRHPDVRLLSDATRGVPDAIARGIREHEVPPEARLEVRPDGLSPSLQPWVVDNSATAWAAKDPVTVRGRLTYLDFDGVWRPLVNVSVNLWDEDWDFDEHLGVTVTDWNGDWSFSVNNNDGWGANGRDIYYTFKLSNTRIRVEDCDGIDSTYSWHSAVRDDVNDGSVIDFGTETGGTHRKSMQVWSHLNRVWNHSVVNGGQDPGFVDSCFPYDETRWDRFWEEIDIEEQYNDGPDVIFHEYGHAVMWYAYDEDNPSPGGPHGFDDCDLPAGQAWSEGWATGFMLAGRPDGRFNWHEGDGGYAIERHSSGCRTGERNEGWVAAALNDMLDAPDDANGGNEDRGRNEVADRNAGQRVGFATMLRDTLWGSWHTDMLDYWYSLSGELAGTQRSRAHEIMRYNWMSVPAPISCVASRVATRDLADAERVLDDLRTFRDKALAPFPGGRRLANAYYRHSPELAVILLGDDALRAEALEVVRHFAAVGAVLDSNEASRKRLAGDRALIDAGLARRIEGLIERIGERASTELADDLRQVRQLLATVEGRSFEALAAEVAITKRQRGEPGEVRVLRGDLAPASRKALEDPSLREVFDESPR